MNEKIVFPESGLQVGMRVRERDVRADGRPQRRGTVVGHDSEEPFVVYVWWDGNRAPVDLPEKIWPDCLFVIESVPTSIPEHDSPRVSTATGGIWDGPVTVTTEYVRAPERELAPGIVVSADTCDGKPRIQDTRLRCDAMYSYWQREVAEGKSPGDAMVKVGTDYGVAPGDVETAVLFHAGVRWAKERRKAKKKGKSDDK